MSMPLFSVSVIIMVPTRGKYNIYNQNALQKKNMFNSLTWVIKFTFNMFERKIGSGKDHKIPWLINLVANSAKPLILGM